jgi:hypothetical protein
VVGSYREHFRRVRIFHSLVRSLTQPADRIADKTSKYERAYLLLYSRCVSIALIGYLVIRPSITATRGGKILAFVALMILPVLAGGMGASEHLEHSKTTGFCLS